MQPTNGHIAFLLQAPLNGVIFNPGRADPLRFSCDSPAVHLSVRSNDTGPGFGSLLCSVHCEIPASADQLAFVVGLQQRIYVCVAGAPIATLPVVVNGKELIDASGQITEGILIPMDLFPADLQRTCREVRARLIELQERFVRLIRWRQDVDAPHLITNYPSNLYWSAQGGNYIIVKPPRTSHEGPSPAGIRWDARHEHEFTELWKDLMASEPFAHELLREATGLLRHSPRSALLMSATALETGVKEHIGRVLPKASWLMQKLPSPPIFRLLRDYLPKLHEGSSVVTEWKALLPLWKICEKLAEDRNALAHTGRTPGVDEVAPYIEAV